MKTFYFSLSFILLMFFSLPIVRSQNKQYDQTINIIPPSPDAAALGKYGAIPMGLYSGQPQVNIPLYNVVEGDIEINLNLSYSGGGVKVEDISSMVGLGWTLNAGGVITRSVKGKPDDDGNGYFSPNMYLGPRPTLTNNSLSYEAKWRLATGADDGESDIYYFNFGDYTGSFYFDTNKQPRFFKHSNLKIVPYMTSLRLDSFKVVTEKGIEYIFDQKETQSTATKSWTTGQGEPPEFVAATKEFTSSWYLSKIRSPNGHQVLFEYDRQPKGVNYETMGSERSYFRKDVPYTQFVPAFEKKGVKNRMMLFIGFAKRLNKITFSNGYIEFNKGADRLDVQNLPTLGDISIFNNNKKLKKIAFNYRYFSERLMLDNIVESNEGITKPPHRFYYNESKLLPNRLSYAQDHWGYYNGHLENTTLIPSFGVDGVYKPGANRDVDTTFSKIGVLTKIGYPTGGSTIIEYEPNIAFNVNNFPLYNQKKVSYQMMTSPATVTVPNWSTPVVYPTDTLYFTVNTASNITNANQKAGVWADMSMKIPYNYGAGGMGFVGSQYELWDNTTGIKILTNVDFGNPISSQTYGAGNVAYSYNKANKTFLQKDHTYKLIHFVKPDIYNRFNSFPYYFLIEYMMDEPLQNNNVIVGGLRVKNITDVDPVSNNKVKKSYYYTNGLNSSGYLLDYPRYFYDYQDQFSGYKLGGGSSGADQQFSVNTYYKVALSNSYYPLASTKNSYLGYNQVTEITNDVVKTIYKYTSSADQTNQDRYELTGIYLPISSSESTINAHPEAQYRSFDWKRGLLTQKTDYQFVNSKYQPAKVEDHYYSFYNDSSKPNYHEAYNFTAVILQNDWYGYTAGTPNTAGSSVSPYTNGFPEGTLNYYRNDSGYAVEDSVVVKNYGVSDPSKVAIIKTEMLYDTLTLQIKKTITKNSDGSIKTLDYKYPPEYNTSTATSSAAIGIKNLVTKHIINEPVETFISIQKNNKNTIISGEIKSYRSNISKVDTVFLLENKEGLTSFQPSSITNGVFLKNNNYKKRIIFHRFGDYNNLLETANVGAPKSSYIWGYKQQFPIAKILNASYNNVWFDNFESGTGNSAKEDAKTGYYSKTGGYSKSISALTNGIYTLTYWLKSGDKWSRVVKSVSVGNSSYTITIPNTDQIDDILFCPSDANAELYTYDPLIGITSQTSASGVITYYEYDAFQRLKFIKDQEKNIIKSYLYNFQGASN